ncbi:hypothetical protein [Spiroplasma turonicum]|uniref:Uncharacterized protein n=1 Tax=Spiroplasma turonicum TaxID=216946 RepID=A0A0K1P7L3_9MOLU|nr:hypothetical protein [Spiroplasma turonicum]AKU80179.1 hypothetical protein STURON_00933 [Spiroplasma turonicum]ALX71180.1 hypothetical protein STURO_v1c09290 [Spiroplasma turonicum]
MPKIYDENLRKEAIERYKNGENIDKIAKDLNIKAGSQLIIIWYKSWKTCYSYNLYKNCKEVKLMSQKLKREFNFKEFKEKNKETNLLKDKIIIRKNFKV